MNKSIFLVEKKDLGTKFDYDMSVVDLGRRTMIMFGKPNKIAYKIHRTIREIKSHFDGKYTTEWSDLKPSPQIIRWIYSDSCDSCSEFAVIWAPFISKDDMIDALKYDWEGGCGCSHDCCGHWFTNVWSHKHKKFGPIHVVFFGHYQNV